MGIDTGHVGIRGIEQGYSQLAAILLVWFKTAGTTLASSSSTTDETFLVLF